MFLTARPSFLVLAPVCILLGISTSFTAEVEATSHLAWFIFIGAVSAHICVNMLNEYGDFKSGLDLKTTKTPFSGGSGALPSQPVAAKATLIIGLIFLWLTVAIGIYFIYERSKLILPIGIIGITLMVTYTKWINRMPILCLLSPGLGFGFLMVVGTHVLMTGQHAQLPWLISFVPFFLVNNLLLLNQYPDIVADASTGRRTFPIVYGTSISNAVYASFAITSYVLIFYYLYLGFIPRLSLIALAPIACSLYSLFGAIKYGASIGHHPRYLGANVAAAILTPLLLAIAILYG